MALVIKQQLNNGDDSEISGAGAGLTTITSTGGGCWQAYHSPAFRWWLRRWFRKWKPEQISWWLWKHSNLLLQVKETMVELAEVAEVPAQPNTGAGGGGGGASTAGTDASGNYWW